MAQSKETAFSIFLIELHLEANDDIIAMSSPLAMEGAKLWLNIQS